MYVFYTAFVSRLAMKQIKMFQFKKKKKTRTKLTLHVTNGGDVSQLEERGTGAPLVQVRFPSAARNFSAGVNF